MLRIAGKTAGPIGLKKIWGDSRVIGGVINFFFKNSILIKFHGQRRAH